MTVQEVVALAGIAFTLVGVIGGVIARDRFIIRLIQTETGTAKSETKVQTDVLHERVNRIRDEYVRRSDMDNHIVRLDQSVQLLANKMDTSTAATNQRLDGILNLLVKRSGNTDS